MVTRIDVNGITLRTNGFGEYWVGKIRGLARPTYRTTSLVYSGRHGGSVPKQLYGQRLVSFEAGINPDNCEDHIAAREALLDAMPIDEYVPVTVHLFDGRQLMFYAKFEEPDLPIDSLHYTDFQLVALADDYRLFDVTSGNINSLTVNKKVDGGLRFLTGLDGSGIRWLTGSGIRWRAGAGSENAVNTGTVATNPIIRIYGANQNPIIRNTTTGEEIKVNVTTSSTDVIEIDTYLKSTKLNGGNINALVDSTSTYFDLEPGDNLMQFTNDNASGGYAVVEWYATYLGV